MPDESIELACGHSRVGIRPALGGAITHWRWRGIDLLRPTPEQPTSSRQCGSFALLPYSNRIVHGRLRFGNTEHVITPNSAGHPHPLHGTGWQMPWRVEGSTAAAVVLTIEQRPTQGRWPWMFRATQQLVLGEDELTMRLAITNLSEAPMPAGIGFHPFFRRDATTRLTASVRSVLLNDPTMAPTERIAVPPLWDLTAGKAIDGMALDNCFSGWGGRAQLDQPAQRMRLSIEADPVFGHLVVYVPPGQSFCCVEPVSHINDGFNRFAGGEPDTGTVVLQPGEILAGQVQFRVSVS